MSDLDTDKAENARIKVLERILEFIKQDNGSTILEIHLAISDTDARAEGWPSMAAQQKSLQETVQALPVDVGRRVKLVPKRWMVISREDEE